MTIRLIAENILDADDFLSATEQEGPYIGQPVPSSANAGDFRLISKGDENNDIADFVYEGQTTSDGSTLAVADTVLCAYGNDYFVGGNVSLKTTDAQSDIVDNGTFDDDIIGWSSGSSALLGYSTGGQSGHCLEILENGEANPYASQAITSELTIGIQYKFEFYVKAGDEATYRAIINDGDTSFGVTTDTEATGAWVKHQYIFTATNTGNYVRLYQRCGAAAGTYILFDEVSLKPLSTTETKTVNDFVQATGTLGLSAAFSESILDGTDFTLTVPYNTRSFEIGLTTGGDSGDAAFYWSHDGGVTTFGRDLIYVTAWPAETQIDSSVIVTRKGANATIPKICQATNWDLICYYTDSNNYPSVRVSTDNGLTWGSVTALASSAIKTRGIIKLNSGRLLAFGYGTYDTLFYSDNDGSSWSSAINIDNGDAGEICDVIELNSGNLLAVCSNQTSIFSRISTDGGFTWSKNTVISGASNTQDMPCVVQAKNGDIICAYESDEDSLNDIEIKCSISTDNGDSWGSAIAVVNFGNDCDNPSLLLDIDGTIYCAYSDDSADIAIKMTKSTDNGQSWDIGNEIGIKTVASTDLDMGALSLINGHEIFCTYYDTTNSDLDFVRRGMWSAWNNDSCPCAINAKEQKLICDIGIVWHGGAGDVDDEWTFEAEYDYSMKNIIDDSPSKCWRSEAGSSDCNIILKLEKTSNRYLIDSIALFGCNIKTLNLNLNATTNFAAPSITQEINFIDSTGQALAADVGNSLRLKTEITNKYKDHELKNYYLRMVTGSESSHTYRILDNIGSHVILDTTRSLAISANDNLAIFKDSISKIFTNSTAYRCIRLNIPNQLTDSSYYQIGSMLIGKQVTLNEDWAVGYNKSHKYDINLLRTPSGGMIRNKGAERKRTFSVKLPISTTAIDQVLSLLDYNEGKNIALIMSTDVNASTCLKDTYLVKHIGDAEMTQDYLNKFTLNLDFEEVL